MRKATALTFSSVPGTQQYRPGDLILNRRKTIRYLTCKFNFSLHNATGGAKTLSATEVDAFLDKQQVTLRHGKAEPRTVFDGTSFKNLRKLARKTIGADWRGISDATTGLAIAMANGSDNPMLLYVEIPLDVQWEDDDQKDVAGVGPEQLKTFFIEFKVDASGLPASVTMGANPTIQAEFAERSCAYEQWANIPEFRIGTESKDQWSSPDGLVLLYAETSATNAASSLTSVRVRVDNDVVHEQVSAAEIGQDLSMDPGMPTTADLTQDWTVFWGYNSRSKLREYVPGVVTVEDINGALRGTNKVTACLYRPNLTEAQIRNEVSALSSQASTSYRAVMLSNALGVQAEDSLKHFYGLALLSPKEADERGLDGLQASNGSTAVAVISPTGQSTLAARLNAAGGANSPGGQRALAKQTVNIPGGNVDAATFRKTGKVRPTMALQSVGNSVSIR